ncbi:MAG TPA: ferritin-like domain-containing protein [Polyangiaceae bacterium]|nr:ferritin-like domain-containing protein [Polyangiaceae bacterium]
MKRPAASSEYDRCHFRPRRARARDGELDCTFCLDATFRDALRLIGAGASGMLLGCGGAAAPHREPDATSLGEAGSSRAPSGGSAGAGATGIGAGSPLGVPGDADDGSGTSLDTTRTTGPEAVKPVRADTPSGRLLDDPGFELLPCSGGQYPAPLRLGGLAPTTPPDYLEMVGWAGSGGESLGTLCGGASDVDACIAAFDELESGSAIVLGQIVQVITTYYLRGTLGDEALRVGTLPELQAFLGEIDTLDEAALWVESQGYNRVCGASGGVARASGFDLLAFTTQGCDGRTQHLLHVARDGALGAVDSVVVSEPDPYCVVGRRPEGHAARRVLRRSLGEFFAGCAELEAASVPAFVRLARELEVHGAPRGLVHRALRSARQEVRHARLVGGLARRFGATPRWPRCPVGRVRTLERVAHENAVEGCVRETYGALVAHHQRRFARDRSVARVYASIAADETQHAELSWEVAHWAEQRLPRADRRRVDEARRAAARALAQDLARSRSKPMDEIAGLPDPARGLMLAEQLDARLWRHGA